MEHTVTGQSNGEMKHTIKDSVFTDLFSDPKYLLQLYKALHPEDEGVTEGDLKTVTLENVITDGIYNDVGFTKGNKLLILAEAQTTWTANIIIRALEYLVHSYRRYFLENRIDLYKSKKVVLPKPEIYVIYAGKRKKRPSYISLSEEFFGGKETAVEVTVKMIYDGEDGDIINQYISFIKVLDREAQIYGRTEAAVRETIRICKDRNVLKEYLGRKESEVVDIMMQLYDHEEIMRVHILSERRDAAICASVEMCQDFKMTFNDTVDKIAEKFSLSSEMAEEEVLEYWKE